ncbi:MULTISPECIES: methylated-DNA--[protein]-cysteine S-methyltransferase [unclassified Modicisalibacter]|uniref:methylated-DNA--[protein]-cysteine S-methyltransferase n=1 Tax=unclassified Modicisalibacter TaxID=2679913 RepID=UPI001CCFA0C5|nr:MULTISPECIES: methylated-DNA--[protein]-cysteine S-methyltransferase [unclassified Modicisalibacter]MBZ9557675.1 methylated-DNA--[protein]-cysteine S-methyltransferase [Modicisalibacter sp. R2A 31.J]MBZ9573661.1 methylated-DNA--[protein]-cysteine S-methyltransferase [Modicisalibacter sp. MOD 31.J]
MIRQTRIDSPLGEMLLRAENDALTGIFFVGQRHYPADADGTVTGDEALLSEALFTETQAQLEAYFAGRLASFSLPLSPSGSDFQQRVWQALAAIPYGGRVSYGDLARRLGLAPGAARAVGSAVGRNPLTLVVPCHRVVGSQGNLTGYAGGLARKRALLDLEAGQRAL